MRRVAIENIMYKEYLCEDFRNPRFPMPEDIKAARNFAIRLAIPELICSLAAFALYEVRRGRIILALNFFNFVFTGIGIRSKLQLNYWGLMAHGTYCTAIIGGFYIYILIEYFLTQGRESGTAGNRDEKAQKQALGDTTVMIIASLPLLMLFFMGIFSMKLLFRIDEEYEQRKVHSEDAQPRDLEFGETAPSDKDNNSPADEFYHEILDVSEEARDGSVCVICMEKPKDSLFYPCGHMCVCGPCGKLFMGQARHKLCPICRVRIVNIVKVYK